MPLNPLLREQLPLVLGGAAAALLVAWGLRSSWRKRPSPADIERRRRAMLHSIGKIGDGNVNELHGSLAVYSYHVGGMEYTAAQELASLEDQLPRDAGNLIGPVGIKYDPRNPANSIVLAEGWSGFRQSSTKLKQ